MEYSNRLTRRQAMKLGVASFGGSMILGPLGSIAAKAAEPGGTLRFAVSDANARERLDPMFAVNLNDCVYCSHIFDKLVDVDDDWNILPMLATEWSSNDDASVWEFKIREGVTFHDGAALTSEDIVFSIARHLVEAAGSSMFSRLSAILAPAGIEAAEGGVIRFSLTRSDATFPIALGQRQMAIVKKDADIQGVETAIGTGPFKIESWNPAQSWALTKNPAYWQEGLPYFDRIEAVVVPEQATKVQAVVSGQFDLGDAIDVSSAQVVKQSPDAALLVHDGAVAYLVILDVTQKPFDDPRIVEAVKLAQARDAILSASLQGFGITTGDVPVDPTSQFYPKDYGVPGPELERARQLLAEAGYPDGIDITLDTSPVDPGMLNMAIAFKQVVEAAGIRVEIKQWSAETYWNQPYGNTPAFTDYWTYRHPIEAASLFYRSDAPWNYSKFKDAEFDTLIDEAMRITDVDAQAAQAARAYEIVASKAGTAIPMLGARLWVHSTSLEGLRPSRANYMYLTAAKRRSV